MRFLLPLLISAAASPGLSFGALAHAGHVHEVAGHSHWIAIGAAVAAAFIGARIARKARQNLIDQGPVENDGADEPKAENNAA